MNHLRQALTWRPSDPGRFALRNALRAAIVIPVSLVLGRAIGDDQTALFAVFGSVSTLIFADFGGPRAARLVAYLVLAGVGFVLIPIGTVCSTGSTCCGAERSTGMTTTCWNLRIPWTKRSPACARGSICTT